MNNQTPLSWFKEYPAQMTSSPKVITLNAAARGIYFCMRYHCWLNIADGGGIPSADDGYIQQISNCTAEEWQANKAQILKNFQERDGQLFDPALCEQSIKVFDKVGRLSEAGRASGRARRNAKPSAEIKTDDDGDETDKTDKTDKTLCSSNAEQRLNTCSPSTSSLFDTEIGSPAPEPPDGSPTSGRLAAPTSGVPIPHAVVKGSTAKATAAGNKNPDVQRLREVCRAEGGKMPQVADVERLLARYSVGALESALRELSGTEDEEFLEYRFFVDGGAEMILEGRRQ